jgi:hypothetical protein
LKNISLLEPVIGLDCEWKPPPKGGAAVPALLQIANQRECLLIRLNRLKEEDQTLKLPPNLVEFLNDSRYSTGLRTMSGDQGNVGSSRAIESPIQFIEIYIMKCQTEHKTDSFISFLKTGVLVRNDASLLWKNYQLSVQGTVDLYSLASKYIEISTELFDMN